jgi:diaminobutyrate-2-oxoglutarate transaminase
VQTGIGRTGSWFAFERSGVVPDVIVASKGLGGIGMPVSVIVYDERLDVWPPGTHTGTFRGNQLAFAAGAATIEILERDRVFDNVAVQERALMDGLRALQRSVDFIGDVRGRGLMIGVEVIDPCTGEPDGARAQQLQSAALGLGLLTEVGGRDGAVIRLLPPLNVDDATVDAALDILHEAAEPKRAKSDPGR